MKRIFPAFAYGEGPRKRCWWDETADVPAFPKLENDIQCDVAVIGGGITGLSAALHLAQKGASVVVLEAHRIGWGASGRNGGFCCLGGGKISDGSLDRRFGRPGRLEWRAAEKCAVDLVAQLITDLDLDVDRHSEGETVLAHRAGNVSAMKADMATLKENYGVSAQFCASDQLRGMGMGGDFYGALTIPVGFGLNPRKYLAGLARSARAARVMMFENSPADRVSSREILSTQFRVNADRVVVATNGYSSEDIPTWMASRYMPVQSNVLVTRPLTDSELTAQGWTTDQMAFDTRHLLHYFRLMPDRRFLFGKRGGLMSSRRAETRACASVKRDFHAMFPAWRKVEVTHSWSGMACLARNRVPFVGEIAEQPGILAGFAFHGNGVAMGTFAGKLLAELALSNTPALYPAAMRDPAKQFPLGRFRRIIMPPLYASLQVRDMWP